MAVAETIAGQTVEKGMTMTVEVTMTDQVVEKVTTIVTLACWWGHW